MEIKYGPELSEAEDALSVIVKDPEIRSWLEKNDPMALKQAEAALAKIKEVEGGGFGYGKGRRP